MRHAPSTTATSPVPPTWKKHEDIRKSHFAGKRKEERRRECNEENFKFVIISVSYSTLTAVVVEVFRAILLRLLQISWNTSGNKNGKKEKASKLPCHKVAYKINLNGFSLRVFISSQPWWNCMQKVSNLPPALLAPLFIIVFISCLNKWNS